MAKFVDVEWLKSHCKTEGNTSNHDFEDAIAKWLDCAPNADVVPDIHAHWKVVFNNPIITHHYLYECSNCESTFWMCRDEGGLWSYCPACGAKMDEEELEK